jgi:hypothetical protein
VFTLQSPTETVEPAEPPVVPDEIQAAIDRDPVNPGRDTALVPEFSGRPVNLEENLLSHILGVLAIVKEIEACVQDQSLKTIDEPGESQVVFFGDFPD